MGEHWGTETKMHDCYVVCPYCGYEHGDAWEWSMQESPETATCQGCEKDFEHWAEHSTTHYTRALQQQDKS